MNVVTVAVGATIGVETRTGITEQCDEQITGAQRSRVDADSENVRSVDWRHTNRKRMHRANAKRLR